MKNSIQNIILHKVRRVLFKASRPLLRSDIFLPLMAWYVGSRIIAINYHLHPELGILILDYERWWKEDLEELGERTQLFSLPSSLREILIVLFLSPQEAKSLADYKFKGKAARHKEALIKYLAKLIPILAKEKKFSCVMTVNHMYDQNKPIAEGCRLAGVPFIDLHKECMKDIYTAGLYKDKCRSQGINIDFLGNKICVYNKLMKEIFTELKVAAPDNIAVTGALRIDRFLRKIKDYSLKNGKKTVVLFSFRHIPTGANPKDYVSQFSPDGSKGYVRLFEEVHCAFAESALANPDVDFIIKLKWCGIWPDYIKKAMSKNGYQLEKINNLRVIANEEENAQDLILKSIGVVGLNSTTLLEARLAGKPAILPYFAEISEKYPDTVIFRDVFPEFHIAKSKEELKSLLQKIIDSPVPFKPLSKDILERYFGFSDGKSLERVVEVLKNA